ncbi:MAG: sensor histidine kinase [Gammaproteobacteria bacterium]|nr:MAG: sensor histidine kinase [Gammaproteobacteria bacterium]
MARAEIHLAAQRYEHVILAVMLLLLHLAVWSEPVHPLGRSLLLAHLGMFLLWQPIWQRDRRLDARGLLLAVAAIAVFVWLSSWLLLFGWLLLLIGLIGGRTLLAREERFTYLLALVIVVSDLLIRVTPAYFGIGTINPDVIGLFKYGMLPLCLATALVPATRAPRLDYPVDLFRALFLALVIALLAMASLLNMYRNEVEYPLALFQSLVAIGIFLLLLSWLLSPSSGVRGLAQLWDRSLLNIGTPFETWLAELARCAQRCRTPQEFLEEAMQGLVELPWIAGVEWSGETTAGRAGKPTPHAIPLEMDDLKLSLSVHGSAGPAMLLHCKLLVQLLALFYLAKEREQELARQAQLRGIYETGARVTHDIKNLLQSLQGMIAALQSDLPPAPPEEERRRKGQRSLNLLRRQLPLLSRRLQLALDKLQAPESGSEARTPLREWWETLKTRYRDEGYRFEAALQGNPGIPTELFDSVAENLLENARLKQQTETGIGIEVLLEEAGGQVVLEVRDTGSPLPSELARLLFTGPVDSDQGHGIGLYQAARQAQVLGFDLELVANRQGEVRFRLSGPVQAAEGQYPLFG